jgi:alpha-galactosidase
MDFRAAVALPGHLGVELDVRHLNAADTQALQSWIALYKQLRGQLHQGRVWLGEGQDGLKWQAHGDEAAQALLLLAYRPVPSSHRYAPPLRLPMLDTTARYRLRQVLPAGTPHPEGRHHTAPFFDALRSAEGLVVDGAWLAHAGLPMPRVNAETAFIVQFEKL